MNDHVRPVNPALHPVDACAHCGEAKHLRIIELRATRARAAVCSDEIGCIRRQRRRQDEQRGFERAA